VFDTLGEAFGPSEMEKFWRGVNVFKGFDKEGKKIFKREGGIAGILKDIFDPNSTTKTVDEKINELFDLISNKFTKSIGPDSPLYSSLQKLGAKLGVIFQKIIVSIGTKISDIFKSGANWLKGEDVNKELENGVEKAARLAKESPWVQFLSPVWDGLKTAFAGIFDGFAEIAPQIAKKIIEGLTFAFKAVNYFLSDKTGRENLDKDALLNTGKKYLGGGTEKQMKQLSDKKDKSFDEQMSESFNKLSTGMTGVFNDEKLMKPFKDTFNDAWDKLKQALISGIKDGLKEAWEWLKPQVGPFILKYILMEAAKGFVKGAITDVAAAAKAAEVAKDTAQVGEGLAGAAKLGGKAATSIAGKALAFLGPVIGGITGALEAEETGRSTLGAGLLGVMTGNAKTGSFLGRYGFMEEGGTLDKLTGIAMSGVSGGLTGAAIGGVAGAGVGALPGAIIGAVTGVTGEIIKLSTEKTKEEINLEKEAKIKQQESVATEARKAAESVVDAANAAKENSINVVQQASQNIGPLASGIGVLPPSQVASAGFTGVGAGYSAQTQTSQEASSVTQTLNNIQQTVNKTTENVETTKQNLAKNDDNVKKIADASSQTSIDAGKVVVNLKKFEDNMMEGVNSIRKSVQNVNVNVAVAVQLDPKELEKIIVAQKDSLIRKAVSIIENNISPNASPKTVEKNDISGGAIATTAFGNV
jgi:hypothetical protein